MVIDARETESAVHLSTAGLGNLESNSWLPRSMEHALIEAGIATVSSSVGIEHATIYWTWPIASFVNHAELKITLKSGKTLKEGISRDPLNPRSERSLQLKGGGPVRVEIRMAVQSPSKKIFFGPNSILHSLTILAPHIKRVSDGEISYGDNAVIIDIQEQERLKAIALKTAQRVRRNRLLATAASILAVIGLSTAYSYLNSSSKIDPCNQISITDIGRCQYIMTSRISTSDLYRFSGKKQLQLYHSLTNETAEG